MVDLPLERTSAAAALRALRRDGFVDTQTRVVFVEFNTFNANLGVFGVYRLTFEFSYAGGVITTMRWATPDLTPYNIGGTEGVETKR